MARAKGTVAKKPVKKKTGYVFTGDPNGEPEDSVTLRGYTFELDSDPVEVDEKDESRFGRSSHFKKV